MRYRSFILAAWIPFLLNLTCHHPGEAKCWKGKLSIKGICMNYTLQVLEGNIDTSRVVSRWTDPATNTVYENAFALANPCDFPSEIKEGDEFYFEINPQPSTTCMVCQAFRDKPGKKLAIRVLPAKCP